MLRFSDFVTCRKRCYNQSGGVYILALEHCNKMKINKWYHCDDKHITETNLLTLSNNVYLMFYAKEVDLGT